MLQGLISCFQLLHEVVSLSKCCSREYSRCDRKVSSHNRPCPELLPASVRVGAGRWRDHGDHANTHLITRAWHHRHGQESDNERTWDRILGQAGHSHPGQIQSQLSRMERRERGHWDSCQISLPLTLSGPARAPPHYDTGCSLQHEFYAFGRI